MQDDRVLERSPQDSLRISQRSSMLDRKQSGRFTFKKTQEEEQQTQIQSNRNRIKQQLKCQLNAIINKPIQPLQMREEQLIELGKKLDVEITSIDVENIIPNTKEFFEDYEIHERLGEGCLGLVKRIVQKNTGLEFAVKIVATQDDEIIRNMIIEFKRLVQLSHDNIVKAYKMYLDFDTGFQSESQAFVVMELIHGKEMFEVISEAGHYSEDDAKELFKQLLSAIEYMHRHGICHRDLKPNNILCLQGKAFQIKVTDFNVSKFNTEKIEMWTYTGTVAFSAPEIFTGEGYNQMVDMWSAGCILYSMLSGQLPFNADYLNDLVENIKLAKYDFPEEIFSEVSAEAKDLIQLLLKKDPQERPYPDHALGHSWFRGNVVRKTLRHLTINKNINHLASRNSNRQRQRTFLLKKDCYTGSSDGEDYYDVKIKSTIRKSLFCAIKPTQEQQVDMNHLKVTSGLLRKSNTTQIEDFKYYDQQ
ncbi:unnamed protein product (macronuclear) [Paramecium tetraurelia]|uniref:Protein kinase domain-containing protein n=1 Tax=Paramecium tetraurelia TaxID=5888 RepID=A0EH16_PARTE|nr:uncharacterized protein GSPATT00026931001 [Paramecium tetraurelia]CAK94607.1 unnamed protein product [Paramecium tetraurelia]|eukprot:XP_001461980.1 hypothetical protein (macronuclear) [Paramecium tetraurelia strain d4-2]